MPFHQITAGETLLGLASEHGLGSWEDIVNAPENAAIKDTLTDPGIVKTGANIFIPNKVMKQQPGATDAKHTFSTKVPTAWLRLGVKDAGGTALGGSKFELNVGGKTITGALDASGVLEQAVPIRTTSATLKVWKADSSFEVWDLRIGYMDPITELTGIQARLSNLGFFSGSIDGVLNGDTTAAIKAFQERVGVEPTGAVDDALRQKLAAYYDVAQDETTLDATAEDATTT